MSGLELIDVTVTVEHIFFRSGNYNPDSSAGFELLAHEVAHTIQQASGQVSAGIDSSPSLESAAQLEGRKAVAQKSVLEQKINTLDSFLAREKLEKPEPSLEAKTSVSRPQATIHHIQRSLESGFSLQREAVTTQTPKGTKLNLRGAAFNTKDPVNLRSSMDTKSNANIIAKIPFGTTFLITESISSWYKIKLDNGQTGFVGAQNISVAPDPQSVLHKIKSGDNAIDIAKKHYRAQLGLDLRFYVGVLAKLNPKSIKMPSDQLAWGDESSVTAWKQANPLLGYYIWIPSQAYAQSLKGQVNNGRLQDHPLEAAAEIGKGIVKKTIEELGGKDVVKTLESIGKTVGLIWDDPGAFMTNLKLSFEQGFNNFQTNFGTHLKSGVIDWLQSALGAEFTIPKTPDAAGLMSLGLQVVGLDYTRNLRPMLASTLPAGGLQQLETGGGVLSEALKTGSLTPVFQMVQSKEKAFQSMLSGLPDTIMASLKDFAITSIISAGIKKMLSMLIPGGGLVQAAINIYNAIKFFIDRAAQIARFIKNLTSSFAQIARGNIKEAVKTIEDVLKNGLSLSLGFLASAAGLTKIAGSIKTALNKIQKPAQDVLKKIVDWIKKSFSSLVGRVTPTAKPVAGGTRITSTTAQPAKIPDGLVTDKIPVKGDTELHHVWAIIRNGQPVMLMASTPKEIIAHLQEFKADARTKLSSKALTQAQFETVSKHISQSGQDVSKGIALMRNQLKANPRARNVTSQRALNLPNSKISVDPELNKIAVNTLTSVKKRMETAFPILNGAGISVENLKQAVSLAGGIVPFMKGIAEGKTLSGIDRVKLGELWDLKTNGKVEHRETLKNLFRSAMPARHEFIPSNLMLEVIDRDMQAHRVGQVAEWIDLQHKFRVETENVVFDPSHAKQEVYRGATYTVLQGHVGAIYLAQRDNRGVIKNVEQTTSQAEFHNQLRAEFKKHTTKKDVLSGVKKIISSWIWDGKKMPATALHPMLRWKNNGNFIDVSKDPGLAQFKSKITQEFIDLESLINSF